MTPSARFCYRNPSTHAIEGPFKLSAYAAWVAAGTLTHAQAARLNVWRAGTREHEDGRLLTDVLVAAAAGAAAT